MMRQIDREPELSRTAQLVEAWLVEQVACISSPGSPFRRMLPRQTATARLAELRVVLDGRPALAEAARGLSLLDQLRLTLELVRQAVPVAGVCRARVPGRGRTRGRR